MKRLWFAFLAVVFMVASMVCSMLRFNTASVVLLVAGVWLLIVDAEKDDRRGARINRGQIPITGAGVSCGACSISASTEPPHRIAAASFNGRSPELLHHNHAQTCASEPPKGSA